MAIIDPLFSILDCCEYNLNLPLSLSEHRVSIVAVVRQRKDRYDKR
jgi:hypothetical protein